MGYVSQQVFLFHSSVQDNILLSQGPNDSLTHSAQEAAQLAQATHFLNQVDALHLSGGQKQRVTLARALVRQPGILILDDALASVDAKTERQILEQLKNRPGRNTELIATHRISNLSGVDRILVLDQGRCLQLGTHSELLRDSRGLYASLYEQQARTPLSEGVFQ
jgi:ATP-binding cassette subfamily B protein